HAVNHQGNKKVTLDITIFFFKIIIKAEKEKAGTFPAKINIHQHSLKEVFSFYFFLSFQRKAYQFRRAPADIPPSLLCIRALKSFCIILKLCMHRYAQSYIYLAKHLHSMHKCICYFDITYQQS